MPELSAPEPCGPERMELSASQPIWSLPVEQVYAALQSDPQGLSQAEAHRRLLRYGANRLPPQKRRPLLLRFLDQMVHFMALLLWIAGALAFAAGTPQLGWAIWSVVLINGVFSFWQEFQAERTLAALTRSLPRQVQAWRDGQLGFLNAEELVSGDRLLLEEGDRIPADCRLVVAHDLCLDLSVLTGESLPVARHAEAVASDPARMRIASAERPNLVLAGSAIASGRGEAIVYATGAETEFGQVAHLAAGTRRAVSTLEQQVARIVHTITVIALSTGLISFGLSVLFVGMAPMESLVFAVGIIVAFVPEGLLPQVTLTLALNVQRMARRQALVRRLSAVETLGSVSVICSDKTGTLTSNRMAVEQTWLPECTSPQADRLNPLLLRCAALCSNARLEREPTASTGREAEAPWRAIGDPTETAMLLAAAAAGLIPAELQQHHRRQREIPFDSHRRRMTVLVEWSPGNDDLPIAMTPSIALVGDARPLLTITKGAPLEVLQSCGGWITAAGPIPLDEAMRQQVVQANDALARKGYRVIAVAIRPGDETLRTAEPEALENGLLFLGLLGLYDPPRPEVADAIRQCQEAGIKVTMVTGDYGLTAQAIARQIGLLDAPEHDGGSFGHQGDQADPVRVIDGGTPQSDQRSAAAPAAQISPSARVRPHGAGAEAATRAGLPRPRRSGGRHR